MSKRDLLSAYRVGINTCRFKTVFGNCESCSKCRIYIEGPFIGQCSRGRIIFENLAKYQKDFFRK